jgi:hypothetical protein
VSTLREKLQAELARYDDDAFAALANRGLLRRARKDLEKQAAEIVAESAQELTLSFGGQQVHFDARGAAHARCSCPASGVCQHILAAAISLQSRGASSATTPAATTMAPATAPATASTTSDAAPPAVTTPPADALEELRAALLRMTAPQLAKHCGKAGYRWAWQFVHDLDAEQDLSTSGIHAFRSATWAAPSTA